MPKLRRNFAASSMGALDDSFPSCERFFTVKLWIVWIIGGAFAVDYGAFRNDDGK